VQWHPSSLPFSSLSVAPLPRRPSPLPWWLAGCGLLPTGYYGNPLRNGRSGPPHAPHLRAHTVHRDRTLHTATRGHCMWCSAQRFCDTMGTWCKSRATVRPIRDSHCVVRGRGRDTLKRCATVGRIGVGSAPQEGDPREETAVTEGAKEIEDGADGENLGDGGGWQQHYILPAVTSRLRHPHTRKPTCKAPCCAMYVSHHIGFDVQAPRRQVFASCCVC
jgi:hypothetical protein